jgi:tetratricopeptide (TPR) repeat protein
MAKKNDTSKGIQNIEVTLTKTEQWLEDNYKPLLYGLSVIVLIVGLFWLVKFMSDRRSKAAQEEMFAAEQYFAQDSIKLALNGSGNNLGFLDIIKTYGRTKTGKLAQYYAGACYMQLGEYQNAIDHLKKFTVKDEIFTPEAIALTGDAYVELGQKDKGIDLYLKAAEMADNNFHSPLYLMKAGEMYEVMGNTGKALEIYNKIKDRYSESTEGRNIDKYIARLKELSK